MEKEKLKDRWIAELTLNGITYTIYLESDYPNMRCSGVDIWDGGEAAEKVDYDFKLIVCNRDKNKEKVIKDFSNGELVNELIARGAVMESTHVYGGYRLTKKYFLNRREDETEVHSRILILKDLK